jgi:hypothetical protein
MKHLLRSFLLFAVIALLVACGSSQGTSEPIDNSSLVTDPTVIDNALEVVDLQANDVTVQPGTQVKADVLPFNKTLIEAVVRVDRIDGSITFEKSLLSSAVLEKLTPGTVIVGTAHKRVKRGFLRRITEVNVLGAQLIVKTTAANLKDVFSSGGFRINRQNLLNKASKLVLADGQVLPMRSQDSSLNPRAVLGLPVTISFCPINTDGNQNTKNDQVCVTGSLDLDFGFDLTLQCEGFLCTSPYFDTHVTLTERANLTVEGGLTRSVTRTIPLGTVVLGSFAIPVAGIPVVFIAEADLFVTLDSQVSVSLKYIANQRLEFTAEVELDHGRFDPYTKFDNEINSSEVEVSIEANAKATLTGEVSVLVYGLGGPTVTIDAWARLIAGFPRNPTWEINAGLDLSLGVEMDVFGLINLEWKEKVMGTKWDVAEAVNSKPTLNVREPVDGQEIHLPITHHPTIGDVYFVDFNANTNDQQEGVNCCTVRVFEGSDLKGTTNPGSGHMRLLIVENPGRHNFRVEVTDSFGAITTENFTIKLVSCGEGIALITGQRGCLIQGTLNPIAPPRLLP